MTSLDPPVYDRESLPKIQPLCPYVGQCGGCSLQDLAYEHQVALKLGRLRHVVAAMEPLLSVEVVPAPDPWRYRNKAELSFSSSQSAAETRLTLGYHAARSFTKIVDLDDCLLLPEPLMRVARTVRELAERTGLPPYYQRRHEGVLRHLALRASRLTGQVAVCLVTTRCERAIIERLADELASRHPELAGVYWGINEKLADVANPDEVHLIRGEPLLADRVTAVEASLFKGELSSARLDETLVLELHRRLVGDLVPEWAGRWRDIAVTVGRLEPPPPFQVPTLMRGYSLDLQARWPAAAAGASDLLLELLAFAEGRFSINGWLWR